MKKETIKTTVLALLVISSIVLTINNWFSEKLWPDGYNFFSNIAKYFSSDEKSKSYYLSKENVSNPAKIVLNNSDMRGVYTHSSADFNKMVKVMKKHLKSGLSRNADMTVGTDEEWKNALKTRSIYFTYPVSYDTKTFSAILDTPIKAVEDGNVQEFIFFLGDTITGKPHLFVKTSGKEGYADIILPPESVELDSLIEKYALSSAGEYPYSFELNFDKSGENTEQKITIDSPVILSIKPITAPGVSEVNYFENISQNEELYTKFLKAFGFNASNIRKNVNLDKAIIFVENYGTIKMHPDGLLEFKALNDSKGIEIGDSDEFYDTFIDCIEFVNNVWDTACHEENMNINLSSVKMGSTGNSFVITIDYYAEGMEVATRIGSTDSHSQLNHAIEIEVANSRIISYRQAVRGYRSTGDTTECTGVIEALDTLMANESIKSDKITNLYRAYFSSNGGVCTPCWVAKTAKNETRIIK